MARKKQYSGWSRKVLEATITGQTSCGEFISESPKLGAVVWHYAATDNLMRRTACSKSIADCIVGTADHEFPLVVDF